MIDNQTLSVYQTLQTAKSIFEKKCDDYGAAWRVLRTISMADQLSIKATRIKTVLDNKGQKVNGIGDDIKGEFLGIINYSVMGLIQNKLGIWEPGEPPMSNCDIKKNYSSQMDIFTNYLGIQNPHYLEEIGKLDPEEIAEHLIIKIRRLRNFHLQKMEGIVTLNFGAFLEIILWSAIGHTIYKTTR